MLHPGQVLPREDHLAGQARTDSGDSGEDDRPRLARQHLQVLEPHRDGLLRTEISRFSQSDGEQI